MCIRDRFKNIVMNHNKVLNYVKMDLAKRDDEYGEPVLITDADNFKDKEVSYYYGIPLSKRVGVSDNNFSFRTLNASRIYVIYYQGTYAGRVKAIQQLLLKAKRDTMRTGDLQPVSYTHLDVYKRQALYRRATATDPPR